MLLLNMTTILLKTITGMKPNEIAQDIIDIIDKENIDSAYFVGMCFGNVVVGLI